MPLRRAVAIASPISQNEPTPDRQPRTISPLWIIATLALSVRLLHLWQISGTPPAEVLVGDGIAYDAWAREIVAGPWLGRETFYQAPLYPYVLAALYACFGPSLLVVRLVQSLLGAAACILLALAGERFFDRRVGTTAGFLLAIWPSAFFADALIQKSSLDTFLFCALLACLGAALQRERIQTWLLAGTLLGALTLTRENALVFAPVLAIVAWRARAPHQPRAAAALLAGVALLLTPVALRNLAIGGELHLTTAQFGPNFFIGNNPRATGLYRPLLYGRGDVRFERHDATALAERAEGRTLSPSEVSSYWTGRALSFIAEQPGDWLRLLGRKSMLVINRVEVGDAEDAYTYGEWSTLLALLNPLLSFGLLVPLAAAGVVLVGVRRRSIVLLSLLASYALTLLSTYVMGRYRQPLLPLLLLFASAAIFEGVAALRAGRWRRLAPALAVTAVFAIAANWPLIAESGVRAASLYNLARGLQNDPARLDEAIGLYRGVLELDPSHALAQNNLGVTLQSRGLLDEALEHLRRAVALNPEQGDFVYNLGAALAARGDADGAAAAYRRAIELDPANSDAHNNLGALLQQRGDLEAAAAQFEAAVAADPRNLGALNNLGVNHAARGRLDQAIATFRRALALDPASPTARDNLARALADQAAHPSP